MTQLLAMRIPLRYSAWPECFGMCHGITLRLNVLSAVTACGSVGRDESISSLVVNFTRQSFGEEFQGHRLSSFFKSRPPEIAEQICDTNSWLISVGNITCCTSLAVLGGIK